MFRKAVQDDVIDLCEFTINFTNKVCLIRALLSFQLVHAMSVEQREHCELETLKARHSNMLRRMSRFVRIYMGLAAGSDNMVLALHLFGEWRCIVGILAGERTRLQVCTELDQRIAETK